jgi:hypothetical protein
VARPGPDGGGCAWSAGGRGLLGDEGRHRLSPGPGLAWQLLRNLGGGALPRTCRYRTRFALLEASSGAPRVCRVPQGASRAQPTLGVWRVGGGFFDAGRDV